MVPEAKSSLNKYFIKPGTPVVSVEDSWIKNNSTNTEKYFLPIVYSISGASIVPYR